MAGLILRTSRVSQELQSEALIQKEIGMKRGVLRRRCDPDCCQAGLDMLWSSWMQRKTVKSQEVVELFFLVCLFVWRCFICLVFERKKLFWTTAGKELTEPVAGLQLLGCKFQATNDFQ